MLDPWYPHSSTSTAKQSTKQDYSPQPQLVSSESGNTIRTGKRIVARQPHFQSKPCCGWNTRLQCNQTPPNSRASWGSSCGACTPDIEQARQPASNTNPRARTSSTQRRSSPATPSQSAPRQAKRPTAGATSCASWPRPEASPTMSSGLNIGWKQERVSAKMQTSMDACSKTWTTTYAPSRAPF